MKKTFLFLATVLCLCTMNKATAQVVDFGVTGVCEWELTGPSGNYTLTISGNGLMWNYDNFSYLPPWHSYRNDIKTVDIQQGVTTIGSSAFYGCNALTGSLTLPNSVTSIGDYAFYNCYGLTGSLTLPNSVTSIGDYAFFNCYGLTGSLTLPNLVTTIEDWVFAGCRGLTSVTLHNSVTSIGDNAFSYCSGLIGSLILPNSITSIGNWAFDGCSGLTSVIFPDTLTSIGNYAFRDCSGLTAIYVKAENPPTLGSNVFYNVSTSIPVYVPCGTANAYQTTSWNYFTNIMEDISFDVIVESNDIFMGTAAITQVITCTNNTAIIEAIPNVGYRFTGWNDGDTANPRTITVLSDTSFTAIFDVETSIESINKPSIKIYPNPAIDDVHISLPENVPQAVFMLYDMQGKEVIRQEVSNQGRVEVSNLASGMYIYRLTTDKQSYQGKMVIKN
jgi:hypothetical protein